MYLNTQYMEYKLVRVQGWNISTSLDIDSNKAASYAWRR